MKTVTTFTNTAPGNISNKTLRKIKITILSIIMAVFTLGNSMTVFAMTDTEMQSFVDTYGLTQIQGTGHVHLDPSIPATEGQRYVTVNYKNTNYYICVPAQEAAESYLQNLQGKQQAAQQQTENITSQIKDIGTGITPDLNSASEAISGFIPAINFILGLAVTILTVGMTLLTACDLCYIVFPVIRGKCEDMKAEGKGVSKSRTQKSGETKLAFVSDEAEYAINAAETIQTGKNPVIIYCKKRAVAIIALSVVIFILLTGNLSVITDIAIKAASGIIKIIQEMGA